MIQLTASGRADFAAMAREHEGWIASMFAGLGAAGTEQMMTLLARTKRSVREATVAEGEA